MTRKNKSKKKHIAIITLLIIAIIISAQVIISKNIIADAERTKTANDLRAISSALEAYYIESKSYPSGTADEILNTLEGDNLLSKGSNSYQPVIYLELPDHKDEWGKDYILKPSIEEAKPIFYSSGPNLIDDRCYEGSDDIQR